jgi:hypothetical protein
MSDQVRKFNYGIEDDRFYIQYQEQTNTYLVKDKVKESETILDNVDCDTTPSDLLYMLYEDLEEDK